MSTEQLHVEMRDTRGKRGARHMRASGRIPAVLYGHQEDTLSLSLSKEELQSAVRHHAHMVELKGAVSESAMLKEIQWDAFGIDILHVDLTRVDANEMVTVELEVILRGEAPGTHHGGVVDQQTRVLEIECLAKAIPESLTCSINDLEVDGSITADTIELPPGSKLVTPADTVIVACVIPTEVEEEETAEPGSVEPEVIGRVAGEGDDNEA